MFSMETMEPTTIPAPFVHPEVVAAMKKMLLSNSLLKEESSFMWQNFELSGTMTTHTIRRIGMFRIALTLAATGFPILIRLMDLIMQPMPIPIIAMVWMDQNLE